MSDQKEQEFSYSLTYQDVVEILRLVNESSRCESLELQLGELKLSATRDGSARVPSAASPTPMLSAALAAAPAQFGVLIEGNAAAAAGQIATKSGLVAIRAPMLGTFYRSPAPGEAPYVQPGDVVDEKFTIGLIDVMKLFTQIPAGMAGRVIEIVAQDATLVEHGQPLILIEPL